MHVDATLATVDINTTTVINLLIHYTLLRMIVHGIKLKYKRNGIKTAFVQLC